MSKLLVGTIQKMRVIESNDTGYILKNDMGQVVCPVENMEDTPNMDDDIDVFIYTDKKDRQVATTVLPTMTLGTYGWGVVKEVIPLGAFIDIGTSVEVLIPADELPTFSSVWPMAEDKVYVLLKKDKQNRLLALPAKENVLADLFVAADEAELNDRLGGYVVRAGKEGSVIITEENYRGFIHHTEREKEPRLGEQVTGRVIEVKEDGTMNMSLRPLKHERMAGDAQKVLAYLEANDGGMSFGNKTDPEVVTNTFGMSKSAFKRALGRLLKEGKIVQDGEGFTLT